MVRPIICGAVDHEGEVLEAYVTKKRDKAAALKVLKKAMKCYGSPQTAVTDRLKSYGAANKHIGNKHRQVVGRWINNRCENSHLPFRRRERVMTRFRRMQTPQQFASMHASLHNHFSKERHLNNRDTFKPYRS
jgi:putative transposase